MHFISNPNLPKNTVKYVVCDTRTDKEITNELYKLGVSIIFVPISAVLQSPVAAHPDMHLFHLENGNFYTSQEYCEIFTKQIKGSGIDCEFFNNTPISKKLNKEYPGDVLLNGVIVGDYLICNKKTIDKDILEKSGKTLISVRQGYTKCSTCIVSADAVITDDPSIAKAVRNKIDVLYVGSKEVKLNGYSCGFIGGCCGKLSKNILAFTGNIDNASYSKDVKAFCKNHGVDCISLSNQSLYDYGSILPIIEE